MWVWSISTNGAKNICSDIGEGVWGFSPTKSSPKKGRPLGLELKPAPDLHGFGALNLRIRHFGWLAVVLGHHFRG